MQYNVKSASFGCTTGVPTYLNTNFTYMIVHKGNSHANSALTFMLSFQKTLKTVRIHSTRWSKKLKKNHYRTETLIHTRTENTTRSEAIRNPAIIIEAIDMKPVECKTDIDYDLSTQEGKSTTFQSDSHTVCTTDKQSTSSQTDIHFQLVDLQESTNQLFLHYKTLLLVL